MAGIEVEQDLVQLRRPDGEIIQIYLTIEDQIRLTEDASFLEELVDTVVKQVEQSQDNSSLDVLEESSSCGTYAETLSGSGKLEWTDDMVKLLISHIGDKKPQLKDAKTKKKNFDSIWEDMKSKGYDMPLDRIVKKWANLLNRYKLVKDRANKTGEEKTNWKYFDLMDEMLGEQSNITPPQENVISSMETTPRSSSAASSSSTSSTPQTSLDSDKGNTPHRKLEQQEKQCRSAKRRNRNEGPPSWFVSYMNNQEKSEQKWREDMKNLMSERNEAIHSLANALKEIAKK